MTDVRDSEAKAIAIQDEDLSTSALPERIPTELARKSTTVSFYGGFGLGNFGNESTLQAILYDLRRLLPGAEVSCICTGPAATNSAHHIPTMPISRTVVKGWMPRNRLFRILRSVLIGIPSELYRWLDGLIVLKGTNVLIVPGTGLLTDAYGIGSWGPYGLFKWSLIAKLCGCKLLFVSVGAGPIYSRMGRWLVRSALALADFRSYRDVATRDYLSSIGASVARDKVYPDLAFSIVHQTKSKCATRSKRRPVVGLGLMLYHRKLSGDEKRESTYVSYLEQLVLFAKWLLAKDYDIRLLIGELSDTPVVADFKALLMARLEAYDEDRIIDEPILSVEDLLAQLAETDAVVATRFHNVLLALTLNRPVISVSFHQKCTSLMESMGLEEYCQDIKQLDATRLIAQFCQLEKNASSLRHMIQEKVADCRKDLEGQYALILEEILTADRA